MSGEDRTIPERPAPRDLLDLIFDAVERARAQVAALQAARDDDDDDEQQLRKRTW